MTFILFDFIADFYTNNVFGLIAVICFWSITLV